MIKKIYTFFYFIALFVLFAAAILSTALFQKDVVPYLAQKYLIEYGVEYKDIEGTLFSGVVLRGVKYQQSVEIDELKIKYNPLMLPNPTPRVSYISAKGVFVDADKILEMQSQGESSPFALNISKVDLQRVKVAYKEEMYTLNLTALDVSLRNKTDIQKITLEAQTPYAMVALEGSVKANRAKGKSTLLLSEKTHHEYLDFLIYTPSELELFFDVSSKEADLKTSIKSVAFKDVDDLVLDSVELHATYNFDDDFFMLFSNYRALYEKNEIAVEQKSRVTFDADIVSSLEAKIVQDEFNLPFESFSVDIKRDKNLTRFDFAAKDLAINAQTKDFQDFSLKAKSIYADLDAKVELKSDAVTLVGELYPKSDAPYLKEYDIQRFSKLNLFVLKNQESMRASIGTDKLSLTLFEDKEGLVGILKAGESRFDIKGSIQKREFTVEANVESIRTLLSELELNLIDESLLFDASAIISAKIGFKDRVEVEARVDIPWYRLEVDTQNIYMDRDAYFEFFYADKEVILKKYDFGVMQKRIFSKRASKIALGEDDTIELREFWIYDNLLLSGELNYSDMSADVTLKSDKFRYESADANVTIKMDIQAVVDSNGSQSISGDIDILEGVVTYVPKKEYAIKDEDIIIIQDIKPPKKEHEKRELNIRVHSSKPIEYKIKDVELLVTPNLVIYQEFGELMQILGTLQIHSGAVTISDREFEFEESEIYFYDEEYTNPYLNLNLHYYTLDNIDIEIYITNRVESPVFILSSNPQMSQDNIISYILFGSSATSAFDTSEEASRSSLSTLALGAGLKGLLDRSVNLKIDTLNILTNEDGTLGYEIGKRFGKKVRLVYKNDDISSLTLQYSLSRSVRIDVDVKETGQGVGIFYIKDFKLGE
ncbi:MAG: translocation/assembly module TamB domain-containing protein [Sulfurimonas sp.]|uniref:translocation/assembly module TamB domain-containing protein n=1 Tax=Sulfurimonas sp. TaxID=2022749 RepID=UPI0028CC5661|nr:translocation/assembly module TamB domain-containing protein [Sulfurimonas sp.]MDT8338305.1 translocation/assembly module TamB domain-containing protein [Sulfurimonas sp.]